MRILQVVNYALDSPVFGGVIRAREIRSKLQILGHEIITLTAFPWEGGATKLGPKVHMPSSEERTIRLGPQLDLIAPYLYFSEYFTSDLGQNQLDRALRGEKFDACFIEQPFMGAPIMDYFRRHRQNPSIIYSSQNIESAMFEEMVSHEFGLETASAKDWVMALESQESTLALAADCVIAVTKEDALTLEEFGAAKVFLSPNGAQDRASDEHRDDFLPDMLSGRTALAFISSAHPPNVRGFFEMLGTDGSFIPPNGCILVVGSVGWPIKAMLEEAEAESLSSRLVITGEVNEDNLREILASVRGLILPITAGGGSNLKTAEALLSGLEVIGTSIAFRGFEEFRSEAGVRITDNAHEFRRLVQEALKLEETINFRLDRKKSDVLTWATTLATLEEIIDFCSNRKVA
tara:strand:- start:10985 stop:12199 length:1215 start_codon:yes stop_codon:yes gene_type:complete